MLFRKPEEAKSDKNPQELSVVSKEVDKRDISRLPLGFQKELENWMQNKHHIEDFGNWVFKSGSLFGARDIWWPAKYKRKFPHEGVDFYYYQSKDDHGISQAKEGAPIELIFPGKLVTIFDDFIGKSILFSTTNTIQHHEETYQFYIMYAHVKPIETLKDMIGKTLDKGDVVFSYNYQKTNRAPPHLHLTTFWAKEKVDLNKLDWDMLNTSPDIVLVDPLLELQKTSDNEYKKR